MSRHLHLPVYQSCYVLTREVFRIQQKLPKTLKHTLGEDLLKSSIHCLRGVIIANDSTVKLAPLDEIISEINVIWVYLRLLYDFKGISKGEYEILSERVSAISPQIKAWKKWDKQKKPH